MADGQTKAVMAVAGISFLTGIFVGYKLKTWRVKYLETKRDYLARKALEAQKQIDLSTGGNQKPVIVM